MSDEFKLPVLDLSLLAKGEEGVAQVSLELKDALENVGFFFLTNHGVDESLMKGIFEMAARFHALSIEEKTTVALNDNKLGYMPFGGSIRKGYSKPSGNAAFFCRFNAQPPVANQWPGPMVPGFEKLVTAYVGEVDALAHRLLPLMARALGVPSPDTFFEEAFKDAEFSIRMSHYPDAAGRGKDGGDMGIAAHTDSGIITLLGQQEKAGLELCMPDGRWVRPQSMPGAFLVNVGDMLRRWTNHKWLSALHRVVNIPGQERYAIPIFWNPRPGFVMEALPGTTSPTNPYRYEPMTSSEFMVGWYAGEYTSLRSLTPEQVKAAEEDPGGFKGTTGAADAATTLPGAPTPAARL